MAMRGSFIAFLAFAITGAHAFVAPGLSFCSVVSIRGAACGQPLKSIPRPAGAPRLRGLAPLSLSMDSDWYEVEKVADVEGGAKYKYTVTVDAQISKDTYGSIMKDFKKNAMFPGFRKGTIPPFMIPKVKAFVVLDCLEKTLGEAVREQGMTLISDEVKPTLDDDQTKELTKNFKETESWTYSIEAELKPLEEEAAAKD